MGSSPFHINRGQNHSKWSKAIPPALTVDSGATVTFDAIDGSNGQITKSSTMDAVSKFDVNLANPVFGPVYVNGAEPGDALEIEILNLETADWGWTAIAPGFGLLTDEFPGPQLKIWQLSRFEDRPYAVFKEGIRIPTRPFLGEMGVAPGSDGEFSTIRRLIQVEILTAATSL